MDPRRLFVMEATAGAASRGSIIVYSSLSVQLNFLKLTCCLPSLIGVTKPCLLILLDTVGAKSEAGDVEVKFPKPLSSQLWNLPRRVLGYWVLGYWGTGYWGQLQLVPPDIVA